MHGGASTSGVVCGIIFVAPDSLSYFRWTVQGIPHGFNALGDGRSSHALSTSAAPLGDQAPGGIDILVITALLSGWWQVRRRYHYHPWFLAMAIGSLGWFAALAICVGTSGGQELTGRTSSFVYISLSLIAALALIRRVSTAVLHRWGPTAITVAVVGALTLFDGLANGWPPYWERLPGRHQASAFERSLEPEEIATAYWTLSVLGSCNRFAADLGIYPLLACYGYQNLLQGVKYMYVSPERTLSIARMARAQAIRYILVDWRLSKSSPASGTYFSGENTNSNYRIPTVDPAKFGHLPGIVRIYDSGNIVIYYLQGLQYAS